MVPLEMRLSDAKIGEAVEFRGFDASLSTHLQDQFLAYGLSPGQPVSVLQQRPMTIILCDQTELAVEHVVAHAMIVGRPEA